MNIEQLKKVLVIVNLILTTIIMVGLIIVYADARWGTDAPAEPQPIPGDQWDQDQFEPLPEGPVPTPSE